MGARKLYLKLIYLVENSGLHPYMKKNGALPGKIPEYRAKCKWTKTVINPRKRMYMMEFKVSTG